MDQPEKAEATFFQHEVLGWRLTAGKAIYWWLTEEGMAEEKAADLAMRYMYNRSAGNT